MKKLAVVIASLAVAARSDAYGADIPGWSLRGGAPSEYTVALDHSSAHTGHASALLAASKDKPSDFGTLMQNMSPSAYAGKRIRFTGYLKTENADHASLWMRIDGDHGSMLGFDNMQERAISGTTPWHAYSIVLDVPKEATNIGFGIINIGGKVWADDLSFEVVDASVPTTDRTGQPNHPPKNLNFED